MVIGSYSILQFLAIAIIACTKCTVTLHFWLHECLAHLEVW